MKCFFRAKSTYWWSDSGWHYSTICPVSGERWKLYTAGTIFSIFSTNQELEQVDLLFPIKLKVIDSIFHSSSPSDEKINGAAAWQNQQNDVHPTNNSDQLGHLPSLIKVSPMHSKDSQGPKVSSCGQQRLWPDRADAHAFLSLCWAHGSFCWFCHAIA